MKTVILTIIALFTPGIIFASPTEIPNLDLTNHFVGYISIGIFVIAYLFVMTEEHTDLRKSKLVMHAVLSMNPDMSTGQWLLVTLTAGVGGSLLSIGSAAGVAVMGQARGQYVYLNLASKKF